MQFRRCIRMAVTPALAVTFAAATFAPLSVAQSSDAARKTFTLEEAVNFALKNYPAVRAAMERTSAAEAGISLAKTNYLPRADMLWQGNRASRRESFRSIMASSPCTSGSSGSSSARERPNQIASVASSSRPP